MSCVIMNVAHRCHVSPYRVFLQACIEVDPLHAEKMAHFLHHKWLIDGYVSDQVDAFCMNVIRGNSQKKKRR